MRAVIQRVLSASVRVQREVVGEIGPGLVVLLGVARGLYDGFLGQLEVALGERVERGIFGADMQVTLTNDGPVTLVIDSRQRE